MVLVILKNETSGYQIGFNYLQIKVIFGFNCDSEIKNCNNLKRILRKILYISCNRTLILKELVLLFIFFKRLYYTSKILHNFLEIKSI